MHWSVKSGGLCRVEYIGLGSGLHSGMSLCLYTGLE